MAEIMNQFAKRKPPAESSFGEDHDRRQEGIRMQGVFNKLANDLGSRYSFDRTRLECFEVYHAAQRTVLDQLQRLAAGLPARVQSGEGIVFLGTVGAGKDHLMAAMLYLAAGLGVPCRWVNGQEVFGQFRDRIDTGQRDEDAFRELCAPQVLGISDPILPVGNPSAWDVGNLYRLLDRRYRAVKSTWVAVNALTVEDADARLSEPVFDRLREGAEIVKCFWPSYRERSKP